MTIEDIRREVTAELAADGRRAPGRSTIRTILRDTFFLRYKTSSGDLYRYNDPRFDNKRLWVSRLLAQFLSEEVIILSMDESSVKQEWLPKRTWQFQPSKRQLDITCLQEMASAQRTLDRVDNPEENASYHGEESSQAGGNDISGAGGQRTSLTKKLFAPFGRVSGPLKKVWQRIGSSIAGTKKAKKDSSDSSPDENDSSHSDDETPLTDQEPLRLPLTPIMESLRDLELRSTPLRRSNRLQQKLSARELSPVKKDLTQSLNAAATEYAGAMANLTRRPLAEKV